MLAREVRILLRKELRQLLRNKSATLTALFLPVLLMLLVPMGQILGVKPDQPKELHLPEGIWLPPGLSMIDTDPLVVVRLMLTPLISMGGLLTPAIMANHTFISERESRTLELLVALPVRVGHILQAKLLAILALAGPLCLGLYAVDAGFMLSRGIGSASYVLTVAVMVVASLAFSCSTALFVSLLAQDIRAASNLTGLVLSPFVIGGFVIMAVVPGTTLASAVLTGGFLLGTAVVLTLALRVVTFERMLR